MKTNYFARVITDYVVFAYMMDVFITEEHRGKGYSSILVDAMMKEAQLKKKLKYGLATADAHFIREIRLDFCKPERMMEK
jgi:GNAT superfamily N-acetyltransferase